MLDFKQWLICSQEKYQLSKCLIDNSKNDPPEEPYVSKYKAKEILESLLNDLENKWGKSDGIRITAAWGLLKYDLGVICLETEEVSAGCDYLTDCWEVLRKISILPEGCILSICVLNQLGILWSGRGEPAKAQTFLEEAENLYHTYKGNAGICPNILEDIFEPELPQREDWKPFERVFTLTLYYLAQVYKHLDQSDKSAKYCHMTLKRQKESEEYDEKEWCVNCATLSQFYIERKCFQIARHLLACSSYIFMKYEASNQNKVDDEDFCEEIARSKAEVAWCWVIYCINLLKECSHPDNDERNKSFDFASNLSDEEDVSSMENRIPCSISDFNEARKVFLFGQEQIKEAKLYYRLDDHANNYVGLVQDHSKLYKHLILYENDLGRQCKMHKRRVNILEEVLSKLNPQYYLAVCRNLRFELGETYYEMMDIKLKIIKSSGQGMVVAGVQKVNALIVKALEHFQSFIDMLKTREGVLPSVYSDELVRPALVAQFYCASLYTKLIELDKDKKMLNLSRSEENYKYIIDYVEKYPEHRKCIEKELPVIEEMIELMPERMLQVTGSTLY